MWVCGIPESVVKQVKYRYDCPNCGTPMYMVNIYIEEEKDVINLSPLIGFEIYCDKCGCRIKFFNDYKVSDKENSNSEKDKQKTEE